MSFPKIISIYKKSTGIIIQVLSVTEESELNLSADLDYIDGYYSKGKFKVENNKVVAYTPNYIFGTNTAQVRSERDMRLLQSDWTQLPDSPLSQTKKNAWSKYRQQLRDMMASYTDSEENTLDKVIFPKPPK